MFVDRQRIDLLNRLIDARVDLAAYVQLRKAKGYMSVSESNHLRDNFFTANWPKGINTTVSQPFP